MQHGLSESTLEQPKSRNLTKQLEGEDGRCDRILLTVELKTATS